jgi:hypothetical protein
VSKIPFDRPDDPLYRSAPLAHLVELPVLGMRVRYETNSETVMKAVERTFGGWRSLTVHPELVSATTVRIRLFVHDGDGQSHDDTSLIYRMPDPNRLLIAGPTCCGVVEVDRRQAYAFVTPALVCDETQFQYGVLEAMTFSSLTGAERYPFHAATVERDGVGILLVGPSGSGKSTLAYAASRNGFRIIGEEVAYVQHEPQFRVWGVPGRVRLDPNATAHFPELQGMTPSRFADGTSKVAVYQSFDESSPAPVAERVRVCVLANGDDGASLERLTAPEVERALTEDLDPGFDRDPELAARGAASLAAGGGWRARLTPNPTDGVLLLREIVEESRSER